MKNFFTLIFVLIFQNLYFGQNTDVEFHLKFNEKDIAFGETYISKKKDTLSFETLRFYISSFQIIYKNDEVFSEKDSYHLIDQSDKESLIFKIPVNSKKEIKAIKFNIGVDSLASVSGAMSGDLDATKGMYWAWQSGFINMKIEGISKSANTRKNKFHLHVGGYLAPNYAMRTIELKVEKGQVKNNIIHINADFSKLFENISLSKTNSVMIPGEEAMKIADYSTKIFSIP
ncbi:MbnP family protein [Frigoriflavimonas asaccharolytica]|uniref:Copper-binding protein MbnP-like domain-containing protein n=1 Tax=Frigoriflavimonas asaccharolytica TaxID=2735899 RepID=A0A8J8G7H9_9FLAO|nr:MbnP family protein [Frigoriflavimonas asaccharolytica]NRS92105.1 hypothetical protein [Frigoriflavimonas asaccharolytica]